jgi:hypothetical protein
VKDHRLKLLWRIKNFICQRTYKELKAIWEEKLGSWRSEPKDKILKTSKPKVIKLWSPSL